MKKLTKKEEEIMNLFWDKGAMFVRELLEHYDEPKPHFNTLSTMVRNLEANGYEFLIYQGKAAMPTSSQSMWPKTLYIQKVAVSRRLREGLH